MKRILGFIGALGVILMLGLVTQRQTDFTRLWGNESHFSINTLSTKNIRLNSQTWAVSSGDQIGVQIKPGISGAAGCTTCTTSGSLRGLEVSPRMNSAVASTNSEGVQAIKADVYLKGATGNITGDIRTLQLELVDDYNSGTNSTRTIAGDTTFFWIRPAVSWETSGTYSVFNIRTPDSGTHDIDALFYFPAEQNIVEISAASASIPANTGYILIKVNTTLYRIAIYANS